MLREKRKHANYKPNRRLDAKSSRGMIYENEELRLRTININAEVERGQSEIKSLKREREQLRREIWTLRDEYDKLENLLRTKGIDPDEFRNGFNSHQNPNEEDDEDQSEVSDCSCESCNEDGVEKSEEESGVSDGGCVKTSSGEQSEQVQAQSSDGKIQEKRVGAKERLKLNFDHLSVVSEEEASEVSSNQISTASISTPMTDISAFLHSVDFISPLSYLQKLSPPLSHFESICENMSYDKIGESSKDNPTTVKESSLVKTAAAMGESVKVETKPKHFFSPIRKKPAQPDVFISTAVQTPEQEEVPEMPPLLLPSFQTGGNLEELLQDIEALSKDIVDLQTSCKELPTDSSLIDKAKKPYRSELNLTLAYPTPPETKFNELPEVNSFRPSNVQPSTVNDTPLTPPVDFKNSEDPNLDFKPVNANVPLFTSNNSIFCTVSAPSTPALDRKLSQEKNKFLLTQASTESNLDKKKQKRVSIINNEKCSAETITKDSKDASSHSHKNHCHSHSQPKRRMSLDNSTTQTTKNKNHRQICSDTKVHRRESNRSNNSFKKRSDSTFGAAADLDQGGTSMSERYSNSIASSRESSTSLSMKSGKRRISITSYGDSKKIPWVSGGPSKSVSTFQLTIFFFSVLVGEIAAYDDAQILNLILF